MYYTVYKTTNLVNGKFYIGMHKTKDLNDGYRGSGKYLKYAVDKYGEDNFVTETLHVFDNEYQMKLAEKILVVPDTEISYNLCEGGKGGFSWLNKQDQKKEWVKLGRTRANNVLSQRKRDAAIARYEANKKHCLQCDEPLKYEQRANKFCNHSCAAKHNNKIR